MLYFLKNLLVVDKNRKFSKCKLKLVIVYTILRFIKNTSRLNIKREKYKW